MDKTIRGNCKDSVVSWKQRIRANWRATRVLVPVVARGLVYEATRLGLRKTFSLITRSRKKGSQL